ncbi:MAG: hypothetical protein ACE366_02020 [Bradymonadia bacterium]
MTRISLKAISLAMVLAGCGDPLEDASYRGEPLLVLQGEVRVQSTGLTVDEVADLPQPASGTLRVALFWSRAAEAAQQVSLIEQQAVTTSRFPARYALSLYSPPPMEVMVEAPEGNGEVAVGLLLVYIDANEDGRWDPATDRLVGGARQRALVYTPSGASSPFFGDLQPGYHRVRTAADGRACFQQAHTDFHSETDNELPLYIDMTFPTQVLIDLDCDGHHLEWSSICPSPEALALQCQGTDRTGDLVWQCGTCPQSPLTDICPPPTTLVTECPGLDPMLCDACPREPDPQLDCEPAFSECRSAQPESPLCEGELAICVDELNDPVRCLDYADACFAAPDRQGACLRFFTTCHEAALGVPPTFGATCRSIGETCLQQGGEMEACRQRFERCAQSNG